MDIAFQRVNKSNNESAGKVVYNIQGKNPVVFNNGVYKTSDKQVIEELLNSDLMRRGYIELATSHDLVEKYLNGDEPDKLTEEVLENITAEGLKKIADLLRIPERQHSNKPSVIKIMVKNKPVTNQIQKVLDENKGEGVRDLLKEAMDAGIIYKQGAWYKYKPTEKSDETNMCKAKKEAQEWCEKHAEELKKHLDN